MAERETETVEVLEENRQMSTWAVIEDVYEVLSQPGLASSSYK